MKKGTFQILTIIAILIGSFTSTKAQQGVVNSGGEATGADGTVSYTVGQLDYKEVSGVAGYCNEGVQQPFEIYIADFGIHENAQIKCVVFPVPTQSKLQLRLDEEKPEDYTFALTSESGQILQNQKVTSKETTISVDQYAAGIYFISVLKNGTSVRTFKIIKNK